GAGSASRRVPDRPVPAGQMPGPFHRGLREPEQWSETGPGAAATPARASSAPCVLPLYDRPRRTQGPGLPADLVGRPRGERWFPVPRLLERTAALPDTQNRARGAPGRRQNLFPELVGL